MKLRMYAVLDKKVEAYLPPLCFRSEGEALRSFVDSTKGTKQIADHASDYAFCFIGFYEDTLGQVTPNDKGAQVVMEGATAVAFAEQNPL